MSLHDKVQKWAARKKVQKAQVVNNIVRHIYQSIVYGSPVTSAPGQPVKTGNLRDAWVILLTSFGQRVQCDMVKAPYAKIIEDGIRAGRQLVLRSKVGGFHSVKLTVAGYELIVRYERRAIERVGAIDRGG